MLLAKASTITILIPVTDEHGVLRFPTNGGPYFGLHKLIDSSQTLSSQAAAIAAEHLGQDTESFTAVTAIDPVLKRDGEASSVLYILRPKKSLNADKSWPTIAEILRSLTQGQTRLAYMKALQYLAGAADAEVEVLEVDEEVRARLRDQSEPPEH